MIYQKMNGCPPRCAPLSGERPLPGTLHHTIVGQTNRSELPHTNLTTFGFCAMRRPTARRIYLSASARIYVRVETPDWAGDQHRLRSDPGEIQYLEVRGRSTDLKRACIRSSQHPLWHSESSTTSPVDNFKIVEILCRARAAVLSVLPMTP